MEEQPLYKTNEENQPNIKELILDIVFSDNRSIFTKKEAEDKVNFVLDMLTDKQKSEVHKKLMRCNFYISKALVGMPIKKIRSLTKRKFNVCKQNITIACLPCEERANNMLKS